MSHCDADALSQLPCKQCGQASHTDEQDRKTTVSTVGILLFQTYTHDDVCELQRADPMLQPVYSAVQKGPPPSLAPGIGEVGF